MLDSQKKFGSIESGYISEYISVHDLESDIQPGFSDLYSLHSFFVFFLQNHYYYYFS